MNSSWGKVLKYLILKGHHVVFWDEIQTQSIWILKQWGGNTHSDIFTFSVGE